MTYQYLSAPDGNCNHVALLSDSFECLLVIPLNTPGQELDAFNAWLAEGNTPLPAPEPEPAPVLTTEQKLKAAGLTVAELKELFGLE